MRIARFAGHATEPRFVLAVAAPVAGSHRIQGKPCQNFGMVMRAAASMAMAIPTFWIEVIRSRHTNREARSIIAMPKIVQRGKKTWPSTTRMARIQNIDESPTQTPEAIPVRASLRTGRVRLAASIDKQIMNMTALYIMMIPP